MKRIWVIGLAAVAILALGVSLAAAQGPDPDTVPAGGYGPNFVDADGDGVCDNCDGSCGQMYGSGGANFIDEDGDGVCDNYGSGLSGQMNRRGGGNFAGGQGDDFFDEDGDGTCDYAGSGLTGARGQGRGRMANRNGTTS